MKQESRQWGLDITRIIATYGIVWIHSGGYAPTEALPNLVTDCFRFALPFFLAVSFYLLSNPKKESSLSKIIFSRWNRLMIPYLIWSLIYVTSRLIKGLITSKSDLINLFQDPFSFVFYGASAVHLYFLPLLFIGNIFAVSIKKITTNFKTSSILFFISLIIYNLILQFNTNFSLKWIKFYDVFYSIQTSNLQALLKFFLIYGWFVIVCLPYIFFGRMIPAILIMKAS